MAEILEIIKLIKDVDMTQLAEISQKIDIIFKIADRLAPKESNNVFKNNTLNQLAALMVTPKQEKKEPNGKSKLIKDIIQLLKQEKTED